MKISETRYRGEVLYNAMQKMIDLAREDGATALMFMKAARAGAVNRMSIAEIAHLEDHAVHYARLAFSAATIVLDLDSQRTSLGGD